MPVLTVIHNDDPESNDNGGRSLLDEIVRDVARKLLAAALQAEVAAYIVPANCVAVSTILVTADSAPERSEPLTLASTWLAAFSGVPAGALDSLLVNAGLAPDSRRSPVGSGCPVMALHSRRWPGY
ncbi:MAG: transposase, mutator family protein [Rhodococcus erythropolis]|jgi:hypothetical protein|nr:transposase, mutator family protein [Rhodococcus erythropolis]